MTDNIETRRKQLLFRSKYRGTKELDLLIGAFADKYVPLFSATELEQFADLLNVSDPEIYSWMTGGGSIPAAYQNPVLELLQAFKLFE